jgi:hypothetical protein
MLTKMNFWDEFALHYGKLLTGNIKLLYYFFI